MVAPRGGRDRRGRGGVPGAVRRVDGGVQRLQVPYAMNQDSRECILLCLLISYHIENL